MCSYLLSWRTLARSVTISVWRVSSHRKEAVLLLAVDVLAVNSFTNCSSPCFSIVSKILVYYSASARAYPLSVLFLEVLLVTGGPCGALRADLPWLLGFASSQERGCAVAESERACMYYSRQQRQISQP